jgi:hypothetical protein
MIHVLAVWWQVGPEWIWHPLGQCAGAHAEVVRCKSYNLHSGILGQIVLLGGVGSAIGVFWHKHNCHEHRCLRLSWHNDAEGHPVCKVHHPEHPAKGWFRSDRKHPRHAINRPVR